MILRFEIILSKYFMKVKIIIFYQKNLKFTKNNTSNEVFSNRIFPYYRFLLILYKFPILN